MQDIDNGFNFDTAIVGESNYKSAISKCYKDKGNLKKGEHTYMDVTLVLENENPYDSNAVAVMSKYGVVGYLPKATAKKYRKDYNNADNLKLRAKIYAPKKGQTYYGIWLDLSYPEALNHSVTPDATNANSINKKKNTLFDKIKQIVLKK